MTLHPAEPPVAIDRVAMRNEWRDLTFLHWKYDPADVQAVLPEGLEVETWEGDAWVGLVPFQMHVRTRRGPYIPWISHFPETNLRTYVRGPNGEVGVWFLSLDAARLPAVLVGRLGYGVPYRWASMRLAVSGMSMTYKSDRLFSPSGGTVSVHVEQGEMIRGQDVTPFQHYLTARWSLFGVRRGRLTFARATHEQWPLRTAHVTRWSSDLFQVEGLPQPVGAPIAFTSPGVNVEIGRPEYL